MEEKKTESERNEDESQQNKKWIESLRFENLPVEDWRTHEELRRTAENLHEKISEALGRHLGLVFLQGNTFFHPK